MEEEGKVGRLNRMLREKKQLGKTAVDSSRHPHDVESRLEVGSTALN